MAAKVADFYLMVDAWPSTFYTLTGTQTWFGVTFDYPETNGSAMRWLGQGPYRARVRAVTACGTSDWSAEDVFLLNRSGRTVETSPAPGNAGSNANA